MTKLTNDEWEQMYTGTVKNHINLIKWLYDNHKDILREYEKTRGKLRIEFLNSIVQDLHETRLELMKEAKEKGMSYDDYVKWEDTSSTKEEKTK